MKSQKMQDEIVGKGNARTVDKSSKTSRMVKDYDVDDFEIANSGGDGRFPNTHAKYERQNTAPWEREWE